MEEKDIIDEVNKKMDESVQKLKEALATVRAGAVNPNVLDKIKIEYYGEMTPIKAVASVNAVSGTQLVVKAFDPTAIKAIIAAIGTSDLGVNPVLDKNVIRINFPPLSGDRRKEFVKQAKGYCEDGKVAIRNIRKDLINKTKKSDEFSEDMEKRIETSIQKAHDEHIKAIDSLFKTKEKELLSI
ncbi:MAG TPA: ribosome recycling factor [Firmicutes bacterium]|nr:ribosome recycling factor [Bacillota bacterium]